MDFLQVHEEKSTAELEETIQFWMYAVLSVKCMHKACQQHAPLFYFTHVPYIIRGVHNTLFWFPSKHRAHIHCCHCINRCIRIFECVHNINRYRQTWTKLYRNTSPLLYFVLLAYHPFSSHLTGRLQIW